MYGQVLHILHGQVGLVRPQNVNDARKNRVGLFQAGDRANELAAHGAAVALALHVVRVLLVAAQVQIARVAVKVARGHNISIRLALASN